MRKILIFTAILAAILVLSGCAQQTQSQAGYYKFTGDKAIEAKFLEGSPTSSELDTTRKQAA